MSRPGEIIRCPWHGWEFDVRTGQSWCEPSRIKAKQFPVEITAGDALVKGPYIAETIVVAVEEDYVVVEV
jgi:nitrite reductase/ring-hydroxylating ferredoxin subunit